MEGLLEIDLQSGTMGIMCHCNSKLQYQYVQDFPLQGQMAQTAICNRTVERYCTFSVHSIAATGPELGTRVDGSSAIVH